MKIRNMYLAALFVSAAVGAYSFPAMAETETENSLESVAEFVGEADAENETEAETEDAVSAVLAVDPLEMLIPNAADYIVLGDFTELELKHYYSTVTDDDLDMELENLQYEYTEYEEVTEGAEDGDILTMNMTYTVDGETTTDEGVMYEIGYAEFGDTFDEEVYGAKADDVIEFEVSYTEDDYIYDEWVDQTVSFSLEITDVSRPVLPELTDEFAQENLDVESLEEYKEILRENLQANTDTQNDQNSLSAALTAAVEVSEILSYPEDMVEETMEMITEQYTAFAEMFGMDVDELFEAYGMDEDQLREQAEADVANRLLISAVIQQEGLTFTEEVLDETAEAFYSYYEYESAEDLKDDFGTDLAYLAGEQVVGEYIMSIATVTEEEDVSYDEDYEFDEDVDYVVGDGEEWFEDDTEYDEEYAEDEEVIWDDEAETDFFFEFEAETEE